MQQPIWTLNARDSILLDLVSDYFSPSDQQMRHIILNAHASTRSILTAKGVDYNSLKNTLIPQEKKREYALVFDSGVNGGHCARDAAKNLIPLINRNSSCSILHGDLIGDDQDLVRGLLDRYLILRRSCSIQHTSQLYCVYLNNLSKSMFEKIDQELSVYHSYIGHIDATYSSRMKDYLSVTVGPVYVKTRSKVICGHEDDASNDENYNVAGWPFEQNGYECISLQSPYFNLFLGYKIERAVYPGFENDTKFALSAIAHPSRDLSDFTVVVDEARRNYLRSKKKASLERAGVENMTALELAEMIRSKISLNYIYQLVYQAEHSVSRFNIMLEISNPKREAPTRLMCGLMYKPEIGELHVATMR